MARKHYDNRKDAVNDLLALAYRFDDKPHLLFSCIRRIAEQYEPDDEDRFEIIRLMDEAFEGAGRVKGSADHGKIGS